MAANQTIEKTVINKTPGVCGGDACIGNRRLPVWQLIEAKRIGFTDQQQLERYLPPLTPADLEAAWSYFEENRDEIEQAILDNEAAMHEEVE